MGTFGLQFGQILAKRRPDPVHFSGHANPTRKDTKKSPDLKSADQVDPGVVAIRDTLDITSPCVPASFPVSAAAPGMVTIKL